MLKEKPGAKLGILYQNDDFGKDYPIGVKDVLGKDWDKRVVKSLTYEVTDTTIDSQIAELQSSGADVLLVVAAPKFAAQAIRKVYYLDWKPLFFMTYVSTSVGAVIRPAGPEKAIGMLSTAFAKDPADPAWDSDPGMHGFKQFMAKYLPGADITESGYIGGYGPSYTMWKVLEQCNGDFSRENVMRQATNIKNLEVPSLLPGIKINTSPTNYHPIRAMQLVRWDGKVRFGELIEGAQT
jgi:branched-chain amino acid transport system substrate-binding protein